MDDNKYKIELDKLNLERRKLHILYLTSIVSLVIALGSVWVSIQNIEMNRELTGGKGELELLRMVVSVQTREKCDRLKDIGTIIHTQGDEKTKQWWDKFREGIGDCGVEKSPNKAN